MNMFVYCVVYIVYCIYYSLFPQRLHCGPRWMWLLVGVLAWACTELSAAPQTFPVAVEENAFSFNNDGTYMFSYDTGREHRRYMLLNWPVV